MEQDHQDVVTPGKMVRNDIHGYEPADLNNMNREPNALRVSTSPDIMETPTQKPAEVTSSAGEQENQVGEDDENHGENAHNQLVLYDPTITATAEAKPLRARKKSLPNYTSRAFPEVGAFAVQCARCFKWRYIHTKEKYEEIREHISERPFYCETTREWHSDKSCDDPPDLTQDGSRLWAIDKPDIAQPPPGWERILRIRAEGGTKFADVYYESPSGQRLRSKVEVERYLEKHPEYVARGAELNKFSFQTPKPLQEEYVKKRRPAPSHDIDGAYDVNPISWVPPDGNAGLLGGSVPSAPSDAAPLHVPDGSSPKKARLTGKSDAVIK